MVFKALKWVAVVLIGLFIVILCAYHFTSYKTAKLHSSSLTDVPKTKVALVLGTSNFLSNGETNLYFKYRMDAAEALFKSGKVQFILVSGDNRKANYNEPKQMAKALAERGIPQDRIVLDYAGFRTLASVVRAKKVFQQQEFIIISQPFHNERALYIARNKEIKAFGFDAKKVSARAGFKTIVREHLARVKMMLDLYILRTEPKFLGEEIVIG